MKAIYVAPQIEIIEIEVEGSVMVLSAGSSDGPTLPGVNTSSRSYGIPQGGASANDLEDMISDILQCGE